MIGEAKLHAAQGHISNIDLAFYQSCSPLEREAIISCLPLTFDLLDSKDYLIDPNVHCSWYLDRARKTVNFSGQADVMIRLVEFILNFKLSSSIQHQLNELLSKMKLYVQLQSCLLQVNVGNSFEARNESDTSVTLSESSLQQRKNYILRIVENIQLEGLDHLETILTEPWLFRALLKYSWPPNILGIISSNLRFHEDSSYLHIIPELNYRFINFQNLSVQPRSPVDLTEALSCLSRPGGIEAVLNAFDVESVAELEFALQKIIKEYQDISVLSEDAGVDLGTYHRITSAHLQGISSIDMRAAFELLSRIQQL